MTTPEIEGLWYKALFEEDCLQIRKLLKSNPELVKVGWESDDNRKVKGCPENHWMPEEERSWMGRTALHVSARRGDVELVQQVLILCDVIVVREDLGHQVHPGVRCEVCGMDPISGRRFKLCSILSRFNLCLKCFQAQGAKENKYAEIVQKTCKRQSGTPGTIVGLENSRANLSLEGSHQISAVDEKLPRSTQPLETPENIGIPPEHSAECKIVEAEMKGEHIAGSSQDGLASEGDEKIVLDSDQALLNYQAARAKFGRVVREGIVGSSDCLFPKKELRELLLSKDGHYGLDGLAMATLQGNVDIVGFLVYALGECDNPPYNIRQNGHFAIQAHSKQRREMSVVTKDVIGHVRAKEPEFMAACEGEYHKHRDFNFLPIEEYLFHFLWTSRFQDVFHEEDRHLLRRTFWWNLGPWPNEDSVSVATDGKEKLKELPAQQDEPDKQQNQNNELWRFFLKLHDGQGRPPFHVALDEGIEYTFVQSVRRMCMDEGTISLTPLRRAQLRNIMRCAMTATDGSGKTGVHRAARGHTKNRALAEYCARNCEGELFMNAPIWGDAIKLEEVANACWEVDEHPVQEALRARLSSEFALEDLAEENGFRYDDRGCTPLQAAIIHNNFCFGLLLFCLSPEKFWNRTFSYVVRIVHSTMHEKIRYGAWNVDLMELVCLLGADERWVKFLLEKGYFKTQTAYMCSRFEEYWQLHDAAEYLPPTLHLVSTFGNYKSLKLFIDDRLCNPFVEDREENTALHYIMSDGISVLGPDFEFSMSLLDYVSCRHLLLTDHRKVKKRIFDEDFFADKKGCVNLLLQAGCDIFKVNKEKQLPYPQDRFTNATFLSWWYEKQTKEFGAIQKSLTTAANAISVTATLVATASFVGPLQPPRGYTDQNQMECEDPWVAIFCFCDTLSFYLAIAAIVLSLIPTLPMPQAAMFEELKRTRNMVTLAVAVLFPSIVSVLIAFASSSMAVVNPRITSAIGRTLAIVSVCIGGVFIIISFLLFSIRLLGIFFPRNSRIKYLYKLLSF